MFNSWNPILVYFYLEFLFFSLTLALILSKYGYGILEIIINKMKEEE